MFQKFFITDPDQGDKTDKKIKDSHIRKLIPNMMTLGSMVCGLTAMQMAITGEWRAAVLLIIAATFLDMLDGAIARLLNATSPFGAELDSLADFLSFGVAPSIIMYLWILHDIGQLGWIAGLVFAIAAALRLARFNVQNGKADDEKPEWARYFFTGVPAPVGAGLALLPMIIYFHLDTDLSDLRIGTPLVALWILACGGLMVSHIPTFSSKQIRLPSFGMVPTLAIIAVILALLIHAPWVTLTLFGLIYLALLPVSYNVYRQREKRHATAKKKKK